MIFLCWLVKALTGARLQFVTTRPGTPIFAKPFPKRSSSQELDHNGAPVEASTNGKANGNSNLIHRLEAAADDL